MPEFVKAKEEAAAGAGEAPLVQAPAEQPQPEVTPEAVAPEPQPEQQVPPVAEPSPAPVAVTPPPLEQNLPEVEPIQPQAEAAGAAPPPLPEPGIVLPTPEAPPPLEGRRKSTYVMRGSGEGVKEETPWAGDSGAEAPSSTTQPVAQKPDESIQMKLPTSAPMPEEAPIEKPAAVDVAKPSRTGLWVVLIFILLGAGGYSAWYFIKKLKVLDSADDKSAANHAGTVVDKPGKIDAGTLDQGDQKPADSGAIAMVSDAGVEKQADKKPLDKKIVDKKPVDKKKKKKKKKKGTVAVVKKPKYSKEQALKFYKEGNKSIRSKRFKAAVKFFKQALKANPRLAPAHRSLGIAYAQLGQNKAACREYRIYSKMIPKDSKELPALKQILKGCK